MKKIYFVILFITTVLSGRCEPTFLFKRINVTNGLSSNYITDLAQDRQGCLWAATESGLNRFDGSKITVYTTSNSALAGNGLNTILADTVTNTIWIGTKRNGISVFDCRTRQFTSYTSKNGLITDDVTNLAHASDGGIWITHYHLGIEHYDPQSKQFTAYRASGIKGLEGNFWCAVDDGNGKLYVGTHTHGLTVVDLHSLTCRNYSHQPGHAESLPGNQVKCIYMDRMRNVWVGTDRGLALFNPQAGTFISFRNRPGDRESLLSDQINDIGETSDGTLWICTQMGGVSLLNLQGNVFTSPDNIRFTNIRATGNKYGISSPNARCFLQDSFGNIWIGNYRGGIDFLSYLPPAFRTLENETQPEETQPGKQVWGIAVDQQNRVWLGGENELSAFKDGRLEKNVKLTGTTVQNTHVSVITKDSNGLLWLGMYKNGVLTYHPETGILTRLPMEEENAEVCAIYEDQDGTMWIGTQAGIYTYANRQMRRETGINASLPDLMVHGFARDRQGNLWIGTFGKGVVTLDAKGNIIRRLNIENGLGTNAVNALYQDTRGELWIGTVDGLAHIADTQDPHPELYNNRFGLNNLNVRAIMEDDKGNIWVSTNGGISQWNAAQRSFYNYTYRQGVPQGDFMDGSAGKDSTGRLYFGSQYGVCCFHPEEMPQTDRRPKVRITEINCYGAPTGNKTDEHAIPIAKEGIRLPYDENTFRIVFNVPDFTLSQQTEYAYQMEGMGNAWFETGNENQIMFRNLPPGNYLFKVKAKQYNQPWGNEYTSIKITVTPPLWLTGYAKLLYAILFGLIIYGVIRFYKHKLDLESRLKLEHQQYENGQQLNNERLRFYTNITHELRTPLTLILGPLEDLLADKTLSARHANKVSIIRDSATRLLNLINQILEFRKTETQNRKLCVERADLGTLVQETGLRYKELNRNNKVNIEIRVETDHTVLYFDPEMLTIILENLMSNAVKYTPEGSITLTLREVEEGTNHYTQVQIADTGYGIEPQALPHIFERYYQEGGEHQVSGSGIGLALVKSLADLHEATISVSSTPGKGSTFTLSLLTDNTYPNASHKEEPDILPAAEEAGEKEETAENEENKPILLVVEDNKDIREYIRSSFCDLYSVLTAANGEEGWELAQNRIPNIIVSDIMMPVMDGIALCKRVKEDMRTSHIPVILLTAKDTLQDKEEGYEAGADSFITKPFSARLLNRRIENLLENRRKLARLITATAKPDNETKETEPAPEAVLSKLDTLFLDKVNAIIEENLSAEKMDVSFIADKMCMSHSTLYRKIKGLTNMSVNEFVRKKRMQKSLDLLQRGEYSIAEVSDMTGFSSVAYFRQCFKEEYGQAPTEYLKQKK